MLAIDSAKASCLAMHHFAKYIIYIINFFITFDHFTVAIVKLYD